MLVVHLWGMSRQIDADRRRTDIWGPCSRFWLARGRARLLYGSWTMVSVVSAPIAAIDYRSGDLAAQLREACPRGIDLYFDNVGGEILDVVLTRINRGARIVICGAISQYNNTTPVKGPSNYLSLLVNRARMEGIVVFDYAPRYPEGVARLAQWLRERGRRERQHDERGQHRGAHHATSTPRVALRCHRFGGAIAR